MKLGCVFIDAQVQIVGNGASVLTVRAAGYSENRFITKPIPRA